MALVSVTLSLVLAGCTVGGDEDASVPDAARDADAGVPDGGSADAGDTGPMLDPCTASTRDSTLGSTCGTDGDCDDRCFCNGVERCAAAVCTAGTSPCDDAIDCTTNNCVEDGDRCEYVPQDAMCDDANVCNGDERCDRILGCVASSVLYCNDDDACTFDTCDPTAGCSYTPRDLDGDGYADRRCGGTDCNDDPVTGGAINPGAPEICDNFRDDNCDALVDLYDPMCAASNDTCMTARMLPGAGTYSGSTLGLGSDFALSCSTIGPDAVFRFQITSPQDVRIAVQGGPIGVIAIRPFAQCATGPDSGCQLGTPPVLIVRSLPAGDYAVIVKHSMGLVFSMDVTFFPATLRVPVTGNETCATAYVVPAAGGVFTGDTTTMVDDLRTTCSVGSPGRDAVFRVDVTVPSRVVASTEGSLFDTVLHVHTTMCMSWAETYCNDDGGAGLTSLIDQVLMPGTYFFVVDGYGAFDMGRYEVQFSIVPL